MLKNEDFIKMVQFVLSNKNYPNFELKSIFSGGLANRGDSKCVEDVKSDWKFADGSGWSKDPLLEASCEKDQSGKK